MRLLLTILDPFINICYTFSLGVLGGELFVFGVVWDFLDVIAQGNGNQERKA